MAVRITSEEQIAPPTTVRDRLSARLRSRRLDKTLARGTPPETAGRLALRARRLTTLSRRRAIANGLRRVIREAGREAPPARARILPRVPQVVAANDELIRLVNTLVSPGPVAARGVAEALILLTDGTGPLYNPYSPGNVGQRAASAADNLRLVD
jgi:hypothetical protein